MRATGLDSEALTADVMRRLITVYINERLSKGQRIVIEVDDADAFNEAAWQEVEALIQDSKTADYRQAAKLLFRLGELANEQGTTRQFMERVDRLKAKYSRRSALMRELRSVQL